MALSVVAALLLPRAPAEERVRTSGVLSIDLAAPRVPTTIPPPIGCAAASSTCVVGASKTIATSTAPPAPPTTVRRAPPTTARPRVTVPPPPGAGVERWRSLVAGSAPPWPVVQRFTWNVDLMLRIMDCESKGVPTARNRDSGALGLFQIYPPVPGAEDPFTNTSLAYAKWSAGGTQPWRESRSCWA